MVVHKSELYKNHKLIHELIKTYYATAAAGTATVAAAAAAAAANPIITWYNEIRPTLPTLPPISTSTPPQIDQILKSLLLIDSWILVQLSERISSLTTIVSSEPDPVLTLARENIAATTATMTATMPATMPATTSADFDPLNQSITLLVREDPTTTVNDETAAVDTSVVATSAATDKITITRTKTELRFTVSAPLYCNAGKMLPIELGDIDYTSMQVEVIKSDNNIINNNIDDVIKRIIDASPTPCSDRPITPSSTPASNMLRFTASGPLYCENDVILPPRLEDIDYISIRNEEGKTDDNLINKDTSSSSSLQSREINYINSKNKSRNVKCTDQIISPAAVAEATAVNAEVATQLSQILSILSSAQQSTGSSGLNINVNNITAAAAPLQNDVDIQNKLLHLLHTSQQTQSQMLLAQSNQNKANYDTLQQALQIIQQQSQVINAPPPPPVPVQVSVDVSQFTAALTGITNAHQAETARLAGQIQQLQQQQIDSNAANLQTLHAFRDQSDQSAATTAATTAAQHTRELDALNLRIQQQRQQQLAADARVVEREHEFNERIRDAQNRTDNQSEQLLEEIRAERAQNQAQSEQLRLDNQTALAKSAELTEQILMDNDARDQAIRQDNAAREQDMYTHVQQLQKQQQEVALEMDKLAAQQNAVQQTHNDENTKQLLAEISAAREHNKTLAGQLQQAHDEAQAVAQQNREDAAEREAANREDAIRREEANMNLLLEQQRIAKEHAATLEAQYKDAQRRDAVHSEQSLDEIHLAQEQTTKLQSQLVQEIKEAQDRASAVSHEHETLQYRSKLESQSREHAIQLEAEARIAEEVHKLHENEIAQHREFTRELKQMYDETDRKHEQMTKQNFELMSKLIQQFKQLNGQGQGLDNSKQFLILTQQIQQLRLDQEAAQNAYDEKIRQLSEANAEQMTELTEEVIEQTNTIIQTKDELKKSLEMVVKHIVSTNDSVLTTVANKLNELTEHVGQLVNKVGTILTAEGVNEQEAARLQAEKERVANEQEAGRVQAEKDRVAKEQEAARLQAEKERVANEQEAGRVQAEKERVANEQEAGRVQAEKERVAKEQEAGRLQAEKERVANEQEAGRVQAEKERVAKEQEAARLQAEKERVAKQQEAARLQAEKERVANEQEAARVQAEKERVANEQEAARVQAEKERVAKEQEAARVQAEKERVAKEQEAARVQAEEERVATEHEQAALEKAALEKAVLEKESLEKASLEKAALERVAREFDDLSKSLILAINHFLLKYSIRSNSVNRFTVNKDYKYTLYSITSQIQQLTELLEKDKVINVDTNDLRKKTVALLQLLIDKDSKRNVGLGKPKYTTLIASIQNLINLLPKSGGNKTKRKKSNKKNSTKGKKSIKQNKTQKNNFTPFRISNALVADKVSTHKSSSNSSLNPDFSVGILNEKMCKNHLTQQNHKPKCIKRTKYHKNLKDDLTKISQNMIDKYLLQNKMNKTVK